MSKARAIAILVVVFVLLALATGMMFYSISVYLEILTATRDFSTTDISFGAMVSSLVGGGGGLVVARLLRTATFRALLISGGAGSFAAMAAIGASYTSPQLWAAYALLGGSSALCGHVVLTELLTRTFPDNPGPMITIASSGMSVGGALIPPVVKVALEAYGVLGGSFAIGAGMFLSTVIAAFIVVNIPPVTAPTIDLPYSDSNASDTVSERVSLSPNIPEPAQHRFTNRSPRRTILLLMIGFGLLVMSQNSTMVHILKLASERQIPSAALILSVIAITSFISRFIGMAVLTQVGIRWFALAIAITQTVGQVFLAYTHDLSTLVAGGVLLGITVGNVFVLTSLFTLAAVPLTHYATSYSFVNLAMTIASAIGPLMLALTFESVGDYTAPILVMAACAALGGVALTVTGVDTTPKKDRRQPRHHD